jgi:hypothetical protein
LPQLARNRPGDAAYRYGCLSIGLFFADRRLALPGAAARGLAHSTPSRIAGDLPLHRRVIIQRQRRPGHAHPVRSMLVSWHRQSSKAVLRVSLAPRESLRLPVLLNALGQAYRIRRCSADAPLVDGAGLVVVLCFITNGLTGAFWVCMPRSASASRWENGG